METIYRIFKISSPKLRVYFFFFFLLAIIDSIIEILSIASILPLLDVLINKSTFFLEKINTFTNDYFNLDKNNFASLIYLLTGVFFIKFISNLHTIFFFEKILYHLRTYLPNLTLKNYISKDFSFFLNNNSSTFIRNVSLEIPKIITGVIGKSLILFREFIMVSFILALLMIVDFKSSIFIFSILVVFGLIFLLFTKKKIHHFSNKRLTADGIVIKKIKEIFENIKLMKILQKEKTFLEIFDLYNSVSAKSNKMYSFISQSPRLFYEFFLVITLLIFCIFFNTNQEKIIYTLAIFAASAVRLIPSVSKIISGFQDIAYHSQSLNELYKDISFTPIIKNKSFNNIHFNEKIIFKNVSFRYPSSENFIFKDLNIEIKKNEFIGIFGSSGSGKSTFFDLISGLIQPSSGRIYIDDFELDKANIYNWQSKIGYMTQDVILMDSSILENISFGEDIKKLCLKRVNESIEKSQLKSLIDKMPNEENTIIGERGLRLSGGERQRIALARTFYFNTEILLLDEITNALDSTNEDLILDNIREIKNKTRIFISHNLNSLKYCDKIFHLVNSKIEICAN